MTHPRLRTLALRYVFAGLNSERIRIYAEMATLAPGSEVEEAIERAYRDVGAMRADDGDT